MSQPVTANFPAIADTMETAEKLQLAIATGLRRIGEIEFESIVGNDNFKLYHHLDRDAAREADCGGLESHHGPADARQISLYAEDGTYRFLKGQLNLRRGWVMLLDGVRELRLALDQFYPASVGIWLAHRDGRLEVEHLREKLARQTGMYRRARDLSDAGAQALVAATCSGEVPCARRILWQLAPDTPLEPSAASRCTGISSDQPEPAAIPLLCAAPCNHFIAECREASKREFLARQ